MKPLNSNPTCSIRLRAMILKLFSTPLVKTGNELKFGNSSPATSKYS